HPLPIAAGIHVRRGAVLQLKSARLRWKGAGLRSRCAMFRSNREGAGLSDKAVRAWPLVKCPQEGAGQDMPQVPQAPHLPELVPSRSHAVDLACTPCPQDPHREIAEGTKDQTAPLTSGARYVWRSRERTMCILLARV